MALSQLAAGTWASGSVASFAPSLAGSPAVGDRMFAWAAWKAFSTTATCANNNGSWTEIAEYTDGAVAVGNGTGSMKVACWYKDFVTGDLAPTITWSVQTDIAAAVCTTWTKAGVDTWNAPTFVTGNISSAANPFTVDATSTTTVDDGAAVMCLIGIRDDSTAITRSTTAVTDNGSPAITWNGNYVEAPATHISTITNNDMSADLGHRLVTTGAAGTTLRASATLSAVETGAALWVVQTVSAPVNVTGTIAASITPGQYEAAMDFTGKADQAMPSRIDTGQTSVLTWVPNDVASTPTIVSNRSVITYTGASTAAGYQTAQLAGTCTFAQCDFNWAGTGTTSGHALGLVPWVSSMPSGFLGAATNTSPLHVSFTPTGWNALFYDGVTNPSIGSHSYSSSIVDNRNQHVEFTIDKANSLAWVTGSDGVEVQISDSHLGTLTCPYLTVEQFYSAANTDDRVRIQNFYGTSRAEGKRLRKGLYADLAGSQSAGSGTDTGKPAPQLIIPNRYVGPMALRQAFRRATVWTTPNAVGVSSTADTSITVGLTAAGVVGTSSTATTSLTVGLTAAGAVGKISTASTAITVGVTAAGVVGTLSDATSTDLIVGLTANGFVGTSSDATSTDITVGLTAAGSLTTEDTGLPAPQLILPNRYVGPMALRYLFRRAQPGIVGADNFNAASVDTAVTVGLSASGVIGTSSSASTAITVGLTAAGVVGTSSGAASTALTIGLTAAGAVGTTSTASTAITVGLAAAGVIGTSSTATTSVTVGLTAAGFVAISTTTTSTDLTVGLTAAGVLTTEDTGLPAPQLIIPNRYVGPMALRYLFTRATPQASAPTVGVTGDATSTDLTVGLTAAGTVGTSTGADTSVTVGLTAAGVVGTLTGADTSVTVGRSADGTVGTSTTASTAITVGLTTAGAVGTVGAATTSITVGLTTAGAVGTVSTANTAITVGLTAAGAVGLFGSADTAITVGVDAGGINPDNVVPTAPPLSIPNRYVGPMALRNSFRRAQQWLDDVISYLGAASATDLTVGLTAAGVVGTSSAASTDLTVGLSATGRVGTFGNAPTATTIGLSAIGAVGTAGSTTTTATTVGLSAAGAVGTSSTTNTTITVGLTATGVLGGNASTSITVGLSAAGVLRLAGSADTATVVGLSAVGVVGGSGIIFPVPSGRTFVVSPAGRVLIITPADRVLDTTPADRVHTASAL